jgi:hypothetical protein
MARWHADTKQDVTNFDGCGFGKYWVISFRLALLMPLKPSHNLLVRGSNPCGGTNQLARVLKKAMLQIMVDPTGLKPAPHGLKGRTSFLY